MNTIMQIRILVVGTSVIRIPVVGTPVVRIPVVGAAVVRIPLVGTPCSSNNGSSKKTSSKTSYII